MVLGVATTWENLKKIMEMCFYKIHWLKKKFRPAQAFTKKLVISLLKYQDPRARPWGTFDYLNGGYPFSQLFKLSIFHKSFVGSFLHKINKYYFFSSKNILFADPKKKLLRRALFFLIYISVIIWIWYMNVDCSLKDARVARYKVF